MHSHREIFLRHLAQTSPAPLGIEVVRAEGSFLYGPNGEKYVDLISGISVSNVGHCHPDVVNAVKTQAEKFMHVMVYGEYIQSPQVKLAQRITSLLPDSLNCVYFTNSGAEAIEGSMKLAKRLTNRNEIISFRNSYHGSTQGALSIMGSETFKNAFRPLIPGCRTLEYNDVAQLSLITSETACVVAEPVQAEAGGIMASKEFMQALRKRCDECGTLLVFDEVQTGYGRTGKLFGFQHFDIVPDIIVFAKGMGGGMPIGAFVSSQERMNAFTENPVLGHITTFGGHPVSCAAAEATIGIITSRKLYDEASRKEAIIRNTIKNKAVKEIRGKGLLLAVVFDSFETNKRIIDRALSKGVVTDWFLFCDNAMRIAPPLNIEDSVLEDACRKIDEAIADVQ